MKRKEENVMKRAGKVWAVVLLFALVLYVTGTTEMIRADAVSDSAASDDVASDAASSVGMVYGLDEEVTSILTGSVAYVIDYGGYTYFFADVSVTDSDDVYYYMFQDDFGDGSYTLLELEGYFTATGTTAALFSFAAEDAALPSDMTSLNGYGGSISENEEMTLLYVDTDFNVQAVSAVVTSLTAGTLNDCDVCTLTISVTGSTDSSPGYYPMALVNSQGSIVALYTSADCWLALDTDQTEFGSGSSGSGSSGDTESEADSESEDTESGSSSGRVGREDSETEEDPETEEDTSSQSGSDEQDSQNSEGQEAESQSQNQSESESGSDDDEMDMRYIIVIAAVIIVIAVVVIWGTKNKKKGGDGGSAAPVQPSGMKMEETTPIQPADPWQNPAPSGYGPTQPMPEPTPAPQPEPVPAPAQSISVFGIAGDMSGRKYEVGDAGIVFGRDPSAGVRFAADVKGISRIHCRLYKNGNGEWQLVDCGSTYGTVLKGYGKLSPQQPVSVKKGDVFYLGSEKNGFSVQ